MNLKRSDEYTALSDLSIYFTWKNIKKLYGKNEFEILATALNDRYCVQNYFEFIIKKKNESLADHLPIKININKI